MSIYYKNNELKIYNGDALDILKTLPGESVNCVVTSPPYWGLRDYGVDRQIGLEESMQEHIKKLVEVFREVKRVLCDDGTCWINYGDAYAGSGKGKNSDGTLGKIEGSIQATNRGAHSSVIVDSGLPSKSLLGLPWRLAFALQDDGWILRQDIVWYKPNPMPESVKDRCTKAHEYIFMFTKKSKYSCEQLTELRSSMDFNPPRGSGNRNAGRRDKGNNKTFRGGLYIESKSFNNNCSKEKTSVGQKPADSIFRNKHSVWIVPIQGGFTSKLDGEHYATFPPTLIDPCIKAGCPAGGIVLDPFFGSGTTAVVALNQNKKCIGIELNPIYCEIAKKRLVGPIELLIGQTDHIKRGTINE